jgi:hypothetical protein
MTTITLIINLIITLLIVIILNCFTYLIKCCRRLRLVCISKCWSLPPRNQLLAGSWATGTTCNPWPPLSTRSCSASVNDFWFPPSGPVRFFLAGWLDELRTLFSLDFTLVPSVRHLTALWLAVPGAQSGLGRSNAWCPNSAESEHDWCAAVFQVHLTWLLTLTWFSRYR